MLPVLRHHQIVFISIIRMDIPCMLHHLPTSRRKSGRLSVQAALWPQPSPRGSVKHWDDELADFSLDRGVHLHADVTVCGEARF